MSAQMTAPFSGVYGEETKTSASLTPMRGTDAMEPDSKFQAFISKSVNSPQESDSSSLNRKDKSERFAALEAFLDKESKPTEQIIRHQGPVVAATAAVSAAPNPQATREMNALLKTEMTSKPLDGPKNTNQFAANTESASQGAKDKGKQADLAADTLVKKASDIAAKMSPQDLAGMQPKGDSLVGPVAEGVLHVTGHNVAAVAVGVLSAEGQGTFAANKTPTQPSLSKREERAMAKAGVPTRVYDQAPQATITPAQPANTQTQQFFDKMGKGAGFDTGRLASQESLKDLKVGNIENVVKQSRAWTSLESAGIDADRTQKTLQAMKEKGFIEDGGKQKLTPELQAFAKPTAPSLPGPRG